MDTEDVSFREVFEQLVVFPEIIHLTVTYFTMNCLPIKEVTVPLSIVMVLENK